MKAARDLRRLVCDQGFTPSTKDVAPLLELADDSDYAEHVERTLARLGPALAGALAKPFTNATPRGRLHACRALGRLADATPTSLALLGSALRDKDERTRRAAVTALGKAGTNADAGVREEIETTLLAAWSTVGAGAEQRVLAEALGKVGGERSMRALATVVTYDDENLARIISRAQLVLSRTERRREKGGIVADRAPPGDGWPVLFESRRGLEPIVCDQLPPALEAAVIGPGRVRAVLRAPLASAWVSRSAERFMLLLPAVRTPKPADLARTVADQLAAAEPLLRALTEGPIRFRIAFRSGGHRRAVVWKIAEEVAARTPALVNDPTASDWQLEVDDRGNSLELALTPRGLPDPRFTYRQRDVPAASHPTVAAALAHVAGVAPGDVVWDPFLGSGLEIVERAKLGAYRALHGSDADANAIAAARANFESAGISVTVEQADALEYFPRGANLVISNPPMGRRLHRKAGIVDFLWSFVLHVGGNLPPGGRLVWLSPQPSRTREAAIKAGMRVDRMLSVDLGGFDAELQVLVKNRR